MNELQKELVDGIKEVTMSTGLTVQECIRQAIALQDKHNYRHRLFEDMFGKW